LARYKIIDTSPRFIALDLERHLLPGTFEQAVIHLIDYGSDASRSILCPVFAKVLRMGRGAIFPVGLNT